MLLVANRLKKDEDYKSVFKYGRSFYGANLRLKLKSNNLQVSRFGIVIGTVISKRSNKRNLLRRRLTENLRLKIKEKKTRVGFDTVINVKPEALKLDYGQLDLEMTELLKRAGLMGLSPKATVP